MTESRQCLYDPARDRRRKAYTGELSNFRVTLSWMAAKLRSGTPEEILLLIQEIWNLPTDQDAVNYLVHRYWISSERYSLGILTFWESRPVHTQSEHKLVFEENLQTRENSATEPDVAMGGHNPRQVDKNSPKQLRLILITMTSICSELNILLRILHVYSSEWVCFIYCKAVQTQGEIDHREPGNSKLVDMLAQHGHGHNMNDSYCSERATNISVKNK